MNAQQLKNSILQEAIEGRLVPQDPNDEPASVLLERIRAEKKRLVKEGKLKKKDLEETPISEEEIPFEIPESWEWIRIKSIFDVCSARRVHEKDWRTSGIPFYRAREIGKLADNGFVDNDLFIDQQLYDEFSKSGVPKGGDLMITAVGTLGKVYIVKEGEIFYYKDGSVLCMENNWGINPLYAKYVIESPVFINQYIGESQGTTVATLTMVRVNQYLFPLPPLAEQQRIVAKIEELLPKVEEYGKAQESLDKLNEELPERLKKSILQEAITGRLVPQAPNDEPASVLFDKIRKEKAKLVKEGKLKKKDLEEIPISDDEIPFKIPESWEWTRLGAHISATSGLAYKKDDLAIYSNEYVRVLRGGNIFFGSWSIKDDDVMIGKQFVNDELMLKKGMFISPAVTSLEHMGKTALIREDQKNVVAGGFVLMLIPHYNNETYWEYLNVLFQSGYYREKCKSITNKSGQAFFNLSRAKLLELPIPLPPLAEQKRIVEKIEQLMKEIDKLKV